MKNLILIICFTAISSSVFSQWQSNFGIGTLDPQMKLHIKDSTGQHYFGFQPAYDGPYINLIGEVAGETPMIALGLAQKDYIYNESILCYKDWAYLYGNIFNKGIAIIPDLVRAPDGLYIDKYGSIGIGVENPEAKLQVANGDIYISDIEKGIIMKSPDGKCWRGVLDNSGQLNFTTIDCPDESKLTSSSQFITSRSSESVVIYPNPILGKITVKIGDAQFENGLYEINNLNGQLVKKGNLKSNVETIETPELTKGFYILNIYDKTGETVISKKFIKE
jgi:hypothetical protein